MYTAETGLSCVGLSARARSRVTGWTKCRTSSIERGVLPCRSRAATWADITLERFLLLPALEEALQRGSVRV